MIKRLAISIGGAVQGVGFRPFIYRLAKQLKLNGYVINSSSGVTIEAEGSESRLTEFIFKIEAEKPIHARISSMEYSFLDPLGFISFDIRESVNNGEASALILPDISMCNDCLKEMLDPNNRRYLYPFINCTNCGPRFSIIEKIPYDRPNTSMKIFQMCNECKKEYEDPNDRRFHAQPIACPNCGPHLELWDLEGEIIAIHHESLIEAVHQIKAGQYNCIKRIRWFSIDC